MSSGDTTKVGRVPERTRFAACLAVMALWWTLGGAAPSGPPSPLGPVPSPRQLAWEDLEFYGFIHFGMNTFTDKEWGDGSEDERTFDPTAFDARQWARVARDAGMKGLILTAKHHDGFCLWPSAFTQHSVKNSAWDNGHGDVVAALAAACREYGLRFGVYLSPWDRNRADYGTAAYLEYYRAQLRELLAHDGPLFEVWFDGANGGDGYYGGARERRTIDASTYYRWPDTWSLVRSVQPDAVMFSDAGPDVRWVGNERGVAFETSWNPIDLTGMYPGNPTYPQVAAGSPDGHSWVPPEVDVSIRPGWFYHQAEDAQVKSVDDLVRIYEQSVGRGANLLLNVPPDRRGQISAVDAARLRQFRTRIADTYQHDLARDATARASSVRANAAEFAASRVNDGNATTYWATNDDVTTGTIDLAWPRPVRFDRIVLQEAIALGQRVEAWTVEIERDGAWTPLTSGTTIGHKRIATFAPVTATHLRLSITKSRACPVISTVAVYLAPGQ